MRSRPVLSLIVIVVMVLGTGTAVASDHDTPATPGASSGDPGSLAAMLGQLPTAPFDQISATMVSYANYAAQFAAVGITMPEAVDEAAIRQWGSATAGLPLIDAPQGLFWPEYQREWREDFGFNLAQIDQVVQMSQPFRLTLMRGRFDPAELRAAWEHTGYETRNIGGAAVAVMPEEAAIELIQVGASIGGMRRAMILDDGTLVFAETGEGMAAVLAVADGRAPSLTDQDDVAMLLQAARPDLVSALIVAGSWLQHDPFTAMLSAGPDATPGIPDFDAMATQTALQTADARRLQPIRAALFGMTAGGPLQPLGLDATPLPLPPGQPAARFDIAVLMTTRGGAERAVPVIEERLASGTTRDGEPYAELFPERTVRVAPEAPVVRIELSLGEGTSPRMLFDMLATREPGFLAW
jgi:hypothetical protein